MANTNPNTEPEIDVPNPKAPKIFWDDNHIQAEAELLPEDLRDLYRRVKIQCRVEYGGDLLRVTEAFAKVGVKRDKTTWSRVFKRGRITNDAAGNPMASPLVKYENLREDFQAFLTSTRVELLRGRTPFVETDTFHAIRRYVQKKMDPCWVNKFGLVVGPTGLQKTASYKELAARDPNIKHIEANERGSLHQFITLFGYKIGVGTNRSHDEKRFQIMQWFTPDKCIIVDNVQDLRNRDRKPDVREETHPAYSFMRWLQDERGGTIIWSITPDDEATIFKPNSVYMEQFEGRVGGLQNVLRLPNHNPKKDLVLIAATLGLKDAEKHADELHELGKARGRIRAFFEVIQQAKREAELDRAKFTWDYVEDAQTGGRTK